MRDDEHEPLVHEMAEMFYNYFKSGDWEDEANLHYKTAPPWIKEHYIKLVYEVYHFLERYGIDILP